MFGMRQLNLYKHAPHIRETQSELRPTVISVVLSSVSACNMRLNIYMPTLYILFVSNIINM